MQKEEETAEIDLSAFDFMHHIRSLLGDLAGLVSPESSSVPSIAPVETHKRVHIPPNAFSPSSNKRMNFKLNTINPIVLFHFGQVKWVLSRFDEAKSALEGMEGLHLSHQEQLQVRDDLLQQIRRKQDHCLRYQRHEIFEGSAEESAVKDEEKEENDGEQQ
jgi:hypothetical protein